MAYILCGEKNNIDVVSMHVNTINFPPGTSHEALMEFFLTEQSERVILKLTCDKLGSLLEVGKYEVGHYVEACKQEYTDLQERQKSLRTG